MWPLNKAQRPGNEASFKVQLCIWAEGLTGQPNGLTIVGNASCDVHNVVLVVGERDAGGICDPTHSSAQAQLTRVSLANHVHMTLQDNVQRTDNS